MCTTSQRIANATVIAGHTVTHMIYREGRTLFISAIIVYTCACILLLANTGCDRLVGPSGGGSIHIPPPYIVSGKPTTLRLELTTWGNDSGSIQTRYTKIVCHYRTATDGPYTDLAMKPVQVEPKQLTVECQLPMFNAASGNAVEYYFDFHFDGVYNQRESPSKPFIVPLRADSGPDRTNKLNGSGLP